MKISTQIETVELAPKDMLCIQLDWAAGKASGQMVGSLRGGVYWPGLTGYSPTQNWAQVGPLIFAEGISVQKDGDDGLWSAYLRDNLFNEDGHWQVGASPLIAATRCYVSIKLGALVNVPAELND